MGNLQLQEKIFATLLGGFVGDALGVPVEFLERQIIARHPVVGMRGFGTHMMPIGTWSDDTSMTLCLMTNLQQQQSLTDLMALFTQWYRQGSLTPFNECFDIGESTRIAIERFEQGVPPLSCGESTEKSNGNGALMRIAPLAFELMNVDDEKKRFEVIQNYTIITHAHPRAIVGSVLYVEMLRNILLGFEKVASLQLAFSVAERVLSKEMHLELQAYHRLRAGKVEQWHESQVSSSGYVVDTLEAAVWGFLKQRNYADTVLTAVNLGDDPDTIAMIAGTFAGAYYGMAAIPIAWRQKMQGQALLKEQLFCFARYIEQKNG